MYIDTLEVGNFRNYDFAKIDFHNKTNILCGDNAQGKTNILESIFVCGTTKSHKGCKDRELIRLGEEEAHIRMHLVKKNMSHRIDMHLKKSKGKGIAIDGIPIKRSGELLGLLNVIFFSPEDLRIIKNGPSERRRFVNMELCQLDAVYLHELGEYNKVLVQRNKLLKQIYHQPSLKETLDLWDMQLVEYGSKLVRRRETFVEEIGEIVTEVNGRLTGGKELIRMIYEPDVLVDDFQRKLADAREKDLKTCSTNVGPHRDDICFLNGDIDLRRYGSQGQQRTCALSLKLAEIELVKDMIGDSPILLLDDVLSELDRKRQNYLLDSIHDIQAIITCTGIEEFVGSRLTLDKIFRVVQGEITVQEDE
ncbi:MAG: DNA replication/repair protein RecF [Lachnospiraceae bacterium]|nr:DNA replication/repair protein RecF [Lachnospiraceae bacterium]